MREHACMVVIGVGWRLTHPLASSSLKINIILVIACRRIAHLQSQMHQDQAAEASKACGENSLLLGWIFTESWQCRMGLLLHFSPSLCRDNIPPAAG